MGKIHSDCRVNENELLIEWKRKGERWDKSEEKDRQKKNWTRSLLFYITSHEFLKRMPGIFCLLKPHRLTQFARFTHVYISLANKLYKNLYDKSREH